MIEILQALEEYYDFLTIGADKEWSKIRICGIKGDVTIEETGYDVNTTLHNLLLSTVRYSK